MTEGKYREALEMRKTRAADALWILGPATAKAVSSVTDDTPGRDRVALQLLEEEGYVTSRKLPRNTTEWTLVRPYDNGTARARVAALLWDEARPMTAPEVSEALGLQNQLVTVSLSKGVAKGIFIKGYPTAAPVYWARGRCSGPEAPKPETITDGILKAVGSDGPLSVEEIGGRFGENRKLLVYRLVRQGRLRLVRLGNLRLYALPGQAFEPTAERMEGLGFTPYISRGSSVRADTLYADVLRLLDEEGPATYAEMSDRLGPDHGYSVVLHLYDRGFIDREFCEDACVWRYAIAEGVRV